MRHPEVRTILNHSIAEVQVPSQDARRERKHSGLQLLVVVLDVPRHFGQYSKYAMFLPRRSMQPVRGT